MAANGPLRVLVGASAGHAGGFDCEGSDRHGRRLLALWSVQRADQQADGGSASTYTKASCRWVGATLVRQVDTDRGGFVTVADGPTGNQGLDVLPAEFTTRCGGGNWQPGRTDTSVAARCHSNLRVVRRSDELDFSGRATGRGEVAEVLEIHCRAGNIGSGSGLLALDGDPLGAEHQIENLVLCR